MHVRSHKMKIAIFVLSLLLPSLRSQESTADKCTAEFDGQCFRRMNCTVEVKIILEKSELFVAYRGQEQEEEVIAQCDWQSGNFHCDPADGYTCDLLPPRYFTVSINKDAQCLSSGEFQVDAAHQQTLRCDISKYRHNVSDLQSPDSRTATKETIDEKKDNTIVAGAVGAVIGGLVVLIVGVGVLVWMKKCRKPETEAGSNTGTHDSQGKIIKERKPFLTELEKNDHRKWTCVKRLRQLLFPGTPTSNLSTV